MVIFVLTRGGFEEMRGLINSARPAVWVNAEVLSTAEILTLCDNGIDLSNFTSPIDPEDEERIFRALATIGEHHPGERIWVETQARPDFT